MAANTGTAMEGRAVLSSRGGGVRVDDLKRIDVTHLSQSELMALSRSSTSAFDLRRTEDVLSPNVDRSVFNESAGSHRQTYSHLHHRSHSRLPGLHPSLKVQRQSFALSDPVNNSVVHFLKHFINGNYDPPPPPPPLSPLQEETKSVEVSQMELGVQGSPRNFGVRCGGMGKRKNLIETKLFENGVMVEMQQVNDKGETVDLGELKKKGDELYAEELKKRTAGFETEKSVLDFLRDLDGQWCSRRKKRKYVNAGVFGNALPIGWKVLLGLRRRDSQVSVYCRRFISPTGEQFMSCKEAAIYLQSYFGDGGAGQIWDEKAGQNARASATTEKNVQRKTSISTVERSLSNSRINDGLKGIDDLPEVQVKDIFECSKCKLTFDDKNVYTEHVLLSHQKNAKRHKFGRPVGEGVIIKDGKFECQFCHKVFDEKRSYSGHVGIHVRNSGKNSAELISTVSASKNIETPLVEEAPSASLKMEALVEIAQSSISETSVVEASQLAVIDPPIIKCLENSAAPGDNEALKLSSDSIEVHEDVVDSNVAMIEDLNQCATVMVESNDMVKNDFDWNVNIEMDASCINESEHARPDELEKFGTIDLDIAYENISIKPSDAGLDDKHSPVPLVQSFQFFPPFSSSNKLENEFSEVDQKLDSVTGFDELRFDDIEPYIPSLSGGSMNLVENSGIELGFNSSVGFGSEGVILSSMNANQLTVCVWCRSEFRLDGIESETPSDSIGYMCPTCKAKISGHFSGSLSMDLHDF